MLKFILISFLVSSFSFAQSDFDRKDEINGVFLKSHKENGLRTYLGVIEKDYSFPVSLVLKSVTDFTDRCNNSLRSKRKFTSEFTDCKYVNENVVEAFVVKDINKVPGYEHFTEHHLIGKHVYNRSAYTYYELVTVQESVNEKNQKVVTVIQKMLSDDEVKKFTTPKFERDHAFDETQIEFTLTEVSPNQTHVTYHYNARTEHWLLNKEISVPQVFASMSKSMNELLTSVEEESFNQKRELASK